MPEPGGDSTLWWEVHVRCSPSPDAASEMAGSILREACTAGLAEAADGWLAYLPDHAAAIALARQIEGVTGLQCTVRLSEEAEWSAWRYAFRPQDVSRRLRIVPVYDVSAHLGREAGPAAAAGRETAYIEPGLAFGTGEHPTTANCLRLLAAHLRPGDTVLDVGTGSGILAIAAATLGASRCLGIDIDPIACRSAAANLALNPTVTGRVEFACMDAGALPGFDLAGGAATPGGVRPGGFSVVLANLTTDLLVRLLPVLAGLTAAGGCLILSGIGIDRAQELAGPLAASGLTTVTSISEHGWLALLCRRSGR